MVVLSSNITLKIKLVTRLVATLLLLFVTVVSSQPQGISEIKILADNNKKYNNIDYFRLLLEGALQLTEAEYGQTSLSQVTFPYSQDRTLQMLKQKKFLDVMHTMTSVEREQEFIAIKIPLLRGLASKRMMFVHKDNLESFKAITQIDQLKKKVACQGLHWPDSDILEQNNFNVSRVMIFSAMFDMLVKGRCDYFPRGVNEVAPEFQNIQESHPDIRIVDDLILSYPAPIYFFVGKHNQALAKRIEQGLLKMHHNGQFDRLLRENPLTHHVFPLSKWQNAKIFEIPNPSLPDLDPSRNPEFWFTLKPKD